MKIAETTRTINEGTGNEIPKGTTVEVTEAPDATGTWPYVIRPIVTVAANAEDIENLRES